MPNLIESPSTDEEDKIAATWKASSARNAKILTAKVLKAVRIERKDSADTVIGLANLHF